jgi:hypothetical protein
MPGAVIVVGRIVTGEIARLGMRRLARLKKPHVRMVADLVAKLIGV